MKKTLLSLLFCCTSFLHLSAFTVSAEGRMGYFKPADQTFKNICNGGNTYGLEVMIPMQRCVFLWGGGSYFSKNGRGITDDQIGAKFTMIPLTAGVKYFYQYKLINFYLGAGVQRTFLQIKENGDAPRKLTRRKGGEIFKVGGIVNLTKCLFMDVFADYSILKTDFKEELDGVTTRYPIKANGWTIGIGIGYHFGI